MEELEALMILTDMPLIGPVKVRFLVDYFGSAKKALSASITELSHLPGFKQKILDQWQEHIRSKKYLANLQLVEKFHAHLISFKDPSYPKQLQNIPDHPPLLYLRGELKPQDNQSITIIGTRQATLYGLEMAKKLSYELAQAGFTIVSGLARGIDTAAHIGALEAGGRTLAIIGSGLANIYPQENHHLADQIAKKGAVISEFSMSTPPHRSHFPKRNRLVSGMSLGTLLIEAPQKSGAILTIENALEQKKHIWALPGRADQENFRGNHALIKNKKAILVENIEDIVQCLDTFCFTTPIEQKHLNLVHLQQEEIHLLQKLPVEELSIEEIVKRAQLPIQQVNSLLMSLVLKKIIKEFPGKFYKKI
ncbi:DNA-processing protein DprA [Candidatus Protochlamydia amoebophila]|uniref:Protein smf n=1 Tax=Candidatus Protochlamydia amoebophila TaxID=362787 RepID=A0A0C1JVC0_9BACT|nr:DNA-processing protein DprA [Candidatus Protochlamydia amoebophila]KIC74361.1 Protein smf [Candidatus Protochlamydia amoebophila]